MQITYDHSTEDANNIKTFWFKPERQLRYIPGQFIELTVPHDNADKRGQKRWFTLSSSPSEPMISITTKFSVENGSSFKKALLDLQPGTVLRISDAMGDFVLPKDAAKPLIFVAGGIGVTPMRSMIKWLADSTEERTVTLLYAARCKAELAFMDLFNSSAVRILTILAEDPGDGSSEVGYLSAEKIMSMSNYTGNELIYLSGPEPMIEGFEKDLKTNGVDKKQLVTDFFPGYDKL